MTTFYLFGIPYVISPGSTTRAGVILSWDTDAKTLAIRFHGVVPQGSVRFEAVFRVSVTGDIAQIVGPPLSIQQPPVVSFDLGGLRSITSPTLTTRQDSLGIEFLDDSGTIGVVLFQDVVMPLGFMVSKSNWGTSGLTFDTRCASHRPISDAQSVTINLLDSFAADSSSGSAISITQTSEIIHVRTFHDRAEILARSTTNSLYLHPDILNTVVADPTAGGRPPNDLLYQYALANGDLSLIAPVSGVGSVVWQGTENTKLPPVLLLLRFQDEHGHPLAFCPDSTASFQGFPLGARSGVAEEVLYSANVCDWSQTNAALVISNNHDGTPISGRIQLLDPVTLYPRYARKDRLNDPIGDPDFIVAGVVPLSGRAPLEIHGIADGAWLVPPPGNPAPIPASFGAIPHSQSATDPVIFHQSELTITGGISGWSLAVLATEKHFHPGQRDQQIPGPPATQTVGFRKLDAAWDANDLRLPAIDTAFALSNLAGITRVTTDGKILGDGFITQFGQSWHRELDGELRSKFGLAALGPQTHVSGFRVQANQSQPFDNILAAPPVSAASTDDTVRTVPSLAQSNNASTSNKTVSSAAADPSSPKPFKVTYLFGGDPSTDSAVFDATAEAGKAFDAFDPLFKAFAEAWCLTSPAPGGDVMDVLKTKVLGLSLRPAQLPDYDLAGRLADAAALASSDPLERFTDDEAEGIDNQFCAMFPEEFGDLWTAPGDGWLSGLLERVFNRPTLSLMRRTYTAIYPGVMAVDDAGKPLVPSPTPPDMILPYLARLQALLPVRNAAQLANFFQHGLSLAMQQGTDALYSDLVDLWRDQSDALGILDSLRARYGSELAPDVYRNILASPADAALLLDALEEQLSIPVANIADIKTAPPEYLLATKLFPVTGAVPDDDIEQLWATHQPLCQLQDAIRWTFFLDDSTTVIIKLKPGRSLQNIAAEIQANYYSAERPDPLQLGGIGAFFSAVDPDVNAFDWLGIFLVRPWIDLSRDKVLRDLCGFDHVDANYIAVGARKPAETNTLHVDTPLQVWAYIEKDESATPPQRFAQDPAQLGDLQFSLVKLNVTVVKSTITAADIQFRLNIEDLLGKKQASEDAGDPTFREIIVRGSLSRTSDGQQLTFGAWFETPYKANLQFAFLDYLVFNSISVDVHNGTTCLEIDGSLALRNWKAPFGFEIDLFDAGGTGGGVQLAMHDFRILLPSLPPGMALPLGQFRNLSFDFPDLGFRLPHPRAFNVWGVEFIPTGVGYVRTDAANALSALQSEYSWFAGSLSSGESIPYLEFDVDFGKFPQFGDSDVRGLRFRAAIACHFKSIGDIDASIGLSGLDATDIKIDFFRILTLTLDTLAIGPGYSELPLASTSKTPIGLIAAVNADLKILGWSPTGGPISFVLVHPLAASSSPPAPLSSALKGGAAWWAPAKPDDSSFFSLHWLLLGHNLTLDPKLNSYLLGADFTQKPDGFSKLVEIGSNTSGATLTGPVLHASLTPDESWVFGISFHLGKILDKCTLVLDDHHFYGIRLYGDWLETLLSIKFLELAYIAGDGAARDKFRIEFSVPALEVFGLMRSGELALEWNPNWDWLIDIGFPWRVNDAYQWDRAFEIPFGCYEARLGFYLEKQSVAIPGGKGLELSAGMGFYLAYAFSAGSSVAWVSAGIGVFAIIQGMVVFDVGNSSVSDPFAILKTSIYSLTITGVIGIYAYGEGGIDLWIISARFRVSVQAAIACNIAYVRGAPLALSYDATLEADYYASVEIGCGFCSWTFTVEGSVSMDVSGHALLS